VSSRAGTREETHSLGVLLRSNSRCREGDRPRSPNGIRKITWRALSPEGPCPHGPELAHETARTMTASSIEIDVVVLIPARRETGPPDEKEWPHLDSLASRWSLFGLTVLFGFKSRPVSSFS
jgi:hypothetical protein